MFGGDTWWMKNFGKKRVCLDIAYFIKTKNLLLKVLQIKVKIS